MASSGLGGGGRRGELEKEEVVGVFFFGDVEVQREKKEGKKRI